MSGADVTTDVTADVTADVTTDVTTDVTIDAGAIRVRLPGHLRALAGGAREVGVTLPAAVAPTQRAVLDEVEAEHPALRGTIRDRRTGHRRAFVRLFACERDLSHDDPDALLPTEVARGDEPLLIVGAMAGG